jgi:vacuolar-type H+-ATPase subunit F/Vma7
MIKPKNKPELMKLLGEKNFKIILIEEGKATDLANQVRKLNSKQVTVIVLE